LRGPRGASPNRRTRGAGPLSQEGMRSILWFRLPDCEVFAMAFPSWQPWFNRFIGETSRRERRRPWVNSWRPMLEQLEDRLAPAVNSVVAANVLTITGTFNDTMVLTSSGGNIKVNGADPNSGVALASGILQVIVNAGPGTNSIDLSSSTLSAYT